MYWKSIVFRIVQFQKIDYQSRAHNDRVVAEIMKISNGLNFGKKNGRTQM